MLVIILLLVAVLVALGDDERSLNLRWSERRQGGMFAFVWYIPIAMIGAVALVAALMLKLMWDAHTSFNTWLWRRPYQVLPSEDIYRYLGLPVPATYRRSWRELKPYEQRRAAEEEQLLATPIKWWPWAPIVIVVLALAVLGIWVS